MAGPCELFARYFGKNCSCFHLKWVGLPPAHFGMIVGALGNAPRRFASLEPFVMYTLERLQNPLCGW